MPGTLGGQLAAADIDTTILYTRTATDSRPAGRITAADLPDAAGARVYVCGPTGFVEAVSDLPLARGHDAADVRTERFGPSGG